MQFKLYDNQIKNTSNWSNYDRIKYSGLAWKSDHSFTEHEKKTPLHFNPADTIYREVAYKYVRQITSIEHFIYYLVYIVYVSAAALNVISM